LAFGGHMHTGWVALVGPEIEENLSLRSLAAALARAQVPSRIVRFDDASQLPGLVTQLSATDDPPFLIGLSLAFQWRASDMLGLAVALKEAGSRAHLTAGGHFATFTWRELLTDFPELDSLCRQEADETLVELACAVRDGRDWSHLPGLARREDGVPSLTATRPPPDLARLPWPVRDGDGMRVHGRRIAPLVSSRGCYANCTFCCIAAWHEAATPGKRYRLRPIADVADELAHLHHDLGVDVFVFHDDNFFVPREKDNLARLTEFADALEARGVTNFATVIKARPMDVTEPVFRLLIERLKCVRAYVGIETDADQGLRTLRRGLKHGENERALTIIDQLGLFVSFNMLLFDPDTTLDSLDANLTFIQRHAHHPFNFARVELYAGTPLLERLQKEGRVTGDWLMWDYALGDAQVQRVYDASTDVFFERNFGADPVAHVAMALRGDVALARHFRPEAFREEWLTESRRISRVLGEDSVARLTALTTLVRERPHASRQLLSASLAAGAHEVDHRIRAEARAVAQSIHDTLGVDTLVSRKAELATPLQRGFLDD
jgi:anaerobic magnesium-protoporphyrin IX monomethyl ester cyclase